MESSLTVFDWRSRETITAARSVRIHAMPLLVGAILGANVISMAVMNFFELEGSMLAAIYGLSMALTIALLLCSRIRLPELSWRDHVMCLALAALFFVPRLTYLFENLLGYAVNVTHDDWYHIQYMASIINSAEFPPRSTFDNEKFLSYYYAPWMLGAVLHQLGIFSTVKQVLALTDMLYALATCYSVFYAAKVLFDKGGLQRTFVVFCVLYGGFDFFFWLSRPDFILPHLEWWAMEFGLHVQFSSFFTLVLWVPQHAIAVVALVYALYIVVTRDSIPAYIVSGIFLASAVFSSPFVAIGAVPLGIVLTVKKRLLRAVPTVSTALILLALPLLWIFADKDSAGFKYGLEWFGVLSPFLIDHKRAAFMIFLMIVILELGPLIWASFLAMRHSRFSRWLVLSGLLYLASIFFVHFFSSNYCMRGAIIPVLTLMYVATPQVHALFRKTPRPWYALALIPYFVGGLYEYASFSAGSFEAFRRSDTAFNARALESNSSGADFVHADLLEEADHHHGGWYLLEKNKPEAKQPMEFADAATFHNDNPYRVTLESSIRLLRSLEGSD